MEDDGCLAEILCSEMTCVSYTKVVEMKDGETYLFRGHSVSVVAGAEADRPDNTGMPNVDVIGLHPRGFW